MTGIVQSGAGEVLSFHPAGGRVERDGARGGADRLAPAARPAPVRGGKDCGIGSREDTARAEAEKRAGRAREGRRDARHR